MKTGMNADENSKEETSRSKDDTGVSGWVNNALGQLDTDFPLSGAETEEDLKDTDEPDEDVAHREHLDTNFPLSGGNG